MSYSCCATTFTATWPICIEECLLARLTSVLKMLKDRLWPTLKSWKKVYAMCMKKNLQEHSLAKSTSSNICCTCGLWRSNTIRNWPLGILVRLRLERSFPLRSATIVEKVLRGYFKEMRMATESVWKPLNVTCPKDLQEDYDLHMEELYKWKRDKVTILNLRGVTALLSKARTTSSNVFMQAVLALFSLFGFLVNAIIWLKYHTVFNQDGITTVRDVIFQSPPYYNRSVPLVLTWTKLFRSDFADYLKKHHRKCCYECAFESDKRLAPTDPWNPEILQFDDPDYKPFCFKLQEQITELVDGMVVLKDKKFVGKCQARDDTNYSTHPQNLTKIPGHKITSHFERPNVYLVVFDSTSSPQFLRSMFRTYYLMKERHEAVVFSHLNKVGPNSRPNAWTLLFGKQIYEILNSPYSDQIEVDVSHNDSCYKYTDEQDWWGHRFRDLGYNTMMAEDWALGALNWYDCKGFKRPSAKHFMKPFQMRYDDEKDNRIRNSFNSMCRESHQETLLYWDQFMSAYKNESQMAFIWNSNLAHDHLSGLYRADKEFYKLLEKHDERLKNSFVFIQGDHGLRFGPVRQTTAGEIEDNNPFLMVSVPAKYRNSSIMDVLKNNAQKLVTHYDTYASFIHLTEIIKNGTLDQEFKNPSHSVYKASHGSSYFRSRMNQPRHCADLRIPFEYCLCDKSPEASLNPESPLAISLADTVVASLQRMIDSANATHLCAARTVQYKQTVGQKLNIGDDREIYKVKIKTAPGEGVFSGYVELVNEEPVPLSNRFARDNSYGKEGDCVVTNESLKEACYCK
ncbi:hypothetical protein L596_021144 [Steinernema carpocapsae]|uniref:Uncharacterized protein n=1 Tax=Steinernema carpocapsae TaxID=34508 RepID=A0A4U5MVM2_STECR|nr:hypothetical protein L596_021144 [Steinernema carpocapsae]